MVGSLDESVDPGLKDFLGWYMRMEEVEGPAKESRPQPLVHS